MYRAVRDSTLGGCLFSKAGSSKRSFEKLLLTHSGEATEFKLISIADFAFDIVYLKYTASYLIPKPGRIQLWSDDIKPLVKFIDQTGIAITEKSVSKLLSSMYDVLRKNFRIHPYQIKINRVMET